MRSRRICKGLVTCRRSRFNFAAGIRSFPAHLMRLRLLARRTQGNTKAVAVDAERRHAPAAVRRRTTLGVVEPTAATAHAERARCRIRGVSHGTTRIISIPILAPLPKIPIFLTQCRSRVDIRVLVCHIVCSSLFCSRALVSLAARFSASIGQMASVPSRRDWEQARTLTLSQREER